MNEIEELGGGGDGAANMSKTINSIFNKTGASNKDNTLVIENSRGSALKDISKIYPLDKTRPSIPKHPFGAT